MKNATATIMEKIAWQLRSQQETVIIDGINVIDYFRHRPMPDVDIDEMRIDELEYLEIIGLVDYIDDGDNYGGSHAAKYKVVNENIFIYIYANRAYGTIDILFDNLTLKEWFECWPEVPEEWIKEELDT